MDWTSILKAITPDDTKKGRVRESVVKRKDVHGTRLFALVESKKWKEALDRTNECPDEAWKWVVKKGPNGMVLWRQLPLHTACKFDPPEDLISALLWACPRAAEVEDTDGLLPVHWACWTGASFPVVTMLIQAFPDSIRHTDHQGRTPMDMAKLACPSQNRREVIMALECFISQESPTHTNARRRGHRRAKSEGDKDQFLLKSTSFTENILSGPKLKSENSIMRAEIDSLKRQLAKKDSENMILMKRLSDLSEDLKIYKEKVDGSPNVITPSVYIHDAAVSTSPVHHVIYNSNLW